MPVTTARILRALTVVVFGAVVVLGFRTLNPPPERSIAEVRGGELNVSAAINGPAGVVTVRGYVFSGPGGSGLRLCQGREASSPPECLGPFLDLDGVNEGSFSLEAKQTGDGDARWVEEPIALRGTVLGTRMTVTEILR